MKEKRYHFGLIAKDIKNSVTPYIYEGYGKAHQMQVNFTIYNIEEDRLEAQLREAAETLDGFNITMPYKQRALPYMDVIEESAHFCGSVNTVSVKNGKLHAHNTDGWGFVLALKRKGIELKGKRAVMLGAGGVGASIAYHLYRAQIEHLDIVNIDLPMAKALAEKYPDIACACDFTEEMLRKCCQNADLFINASVMGQVGYDEFQNTDFLDGLKKDAVIFDVNYSNPDSILVPEARRRGYRAWNGKAMTVCQGVEAFRLWTGIEVSEADISNLLASLQIED